MNRLIFLFSFLLLAAFQAPSSLQAQVVVDGVNINNLEEISMIRMIAQERFLSNRVNVFIDYGQSLVGATRQRMEVIDPRSNQRLVFNSVMHAVNYLIDNGWTYVEAMVLPQEGNASTGSVQYLFVRTSSKR